MILPSNSVRILVATNPVDFRKGHNGLAALVNNELSENPFSGTVFVFRSTHLFYFIIISNLCIKDSNNFTHSSGQRDQFLFTIQNEPIIKLFYFAVSSNGNYRHHK
ncbi:MAG: IS66 family insertion sequence element accessory protein TnpB [Rhizobiales bacterium]|nr:IS66 family insertion sequence element accessory protein TnpB [Hyphomicrobiales bacterium]